MASNLRHILYTVAALIAVTWPHTEAAPIDEAKKLYREGNFAEAVKRFKTLRKASPRDGNVNYYLGASLNALGKPGEAIAPLKAAEDRGVTDASRLLAEIYFNLYDADEAEEHLNTWVEKKQKSKTFDPTDSDVLRSRLVMLRNMLGRVERIEIIDTINVDAADFFTHYRLSPESGQLLTPRETEVKARTVVYRPQNDSELIWSETDSTGCAVLMSASILDDGTLDKQQPLAGEFAPGGDADYPFLMPDGMTLYYAATGDASLGGFDIFMTRRSDDGFLQPQNMGMPYNSPYNDYMLAIDETTGAGWFASDRAGIPGKVTIYVFVPSQTRVNHNPSDPSLGFHARLADITISQSDTAADVRQRISSSNPEHDSASSHQNDRFTLAMGNGKVYTSLEDFTNRQARSEMSRLLDVTAEIEAKNNELQQLRKRWRNGETKLADTILDAEAKLEFLRQAAAERRNKVIRLETK